MTLELIAETEARLLDVPLSDKFYYVNTICAWCYCVGRTTEGKEIYFNIKDKEKVKEIFNSSRNPSHTICVKDYCKEQEHRTEYKERFGFDYQDT